MDDNRAANSGDSDHHFVPATLPSNTDYRHARIRSAGSLYSPRSIPRSESPIVVVGVCSSGKSTLVRTLRDKGYNARAVSQEHSYVPHLWERSNPDVLIYLDANVHTIRGRGRPRWRQRVLDDEHIRLKHARDHCDLYISTDGLSPQDIVSRVVTFLNNKQSAISFQQSANGSHERSEG